MNLKIKWALLALLLFVMIGVVAYTQEHQKTQSSDTEQSISISFNLIFKYGVGARNELNTFDGTFTKDMIVDDPITIPLELTSAELEGIRQKIDELNLFKEQKTYQGDTFTMVSPCSSYDLSVESGGVQKRLTWDCEKPTGNSSENPELDTFAEYIRSIVESKEAYKKLPEPQGGYL